MLGSYGSFFKFILFMDVDVHEEAVEETEGEGDALNITPWPPFVDC